MEVEGEQITSERSGKTSTGLPLPLIGARTLWRFHRNFYLDVLGRAFYLSLNDIDGTILNARGAVIWQRRPLIGVGVGYDWFRVDIDVDRSGFDGSMDWTYSGPQVFLNEAL